MAAKTAYSFFDRISAVAFPKWTDKRVSTRLQKQRKHDLQMIYEAAQVSRRNQHWRSVGTDANTEVAQSLVRLRDVARDMIRNVPYALRARNVITHNVIGYGIKPKFTFVQPRGNSDEAKREENNTLQTLFDSHLNSTSCDADGRLNFYGLQELALNTVIESGECIIRRRDRRLEDGLPLPMQIQVLEPDYLDHNKNGLEPNGNVAINGVVFDFTGKRVGYYIFDIHPGSNALLNSTQQYQSRYVSAEYIVHLFRADRPGQVRGVSWFAAVTVRLRDLAEYWDAQLIKQKISACFAGFIKTADQTLTGGEITVQDSSRSPYMAETLEPGTLQRLYEGEEVTFGLPPKVDDLDPYSRMTMREVAAGLSITYEALTGDLTGVNYSSARIGWIEFQRSIDAWQYNWIIPQALEPIGGWMQIAYDRLKFNGTAQIKSEWSPPHREMLDMQTETTALKDQMRNGIVSWSQVQRERGNDPETVAGEIAADMARFDKLGIILDSDPRKVSGRGVAQKDSANPDDANADNGGADNNNSVRDAA